MNRDKAKDILRIHPPGAGPVDDPEVLQAFQKLKEDDSLRAWYEQEKGFDQAVARNLRAFPVPAGLKNEILEGTRPVAASFPHLRRSYAAAAAILLIAVAWGFLMTERQESSFPGADRVFQASPDFFGDLATFFDREPDYEHFSADLADLSNRVKHNGGPDVGEVFPASLESVEGLRCRVFEEDRKKVALICMQDRDSPLHLFVIEQADGPASTTEQIQPRFTEIGDWSFADWNESGKTCVLATRGSKEKLKPLF